MTEDMHIAITNFRTALTKFWRDYMSLPIPSAAYDINQATPILKRRQFILRQLLCMRTDALRIEDTLNQTAFKGLNVKEN